jgi:hypothetical protein
VLLEQVVDAVASVKGPKAGLAGPADARPSSTATMATTTHAAGGRCAGAGSPRESRGAGSSQASGWAVIGMWWSGRWRGG